jgi:ABC-2 type transport system ATP-binding protein/lipopolysaccharide transport system ATP-binding protein
VGECAIQIDGLTKTYSLGSSSGYQTLRETLVHALRRAAPNDGRPNRRLDALHDINLTVDRGETLGVIGRNGAGKTTLLKILARIIEPTSGVARTRGRVGALLEVGTGFHPELTGRENIYLNGAILGMSRREIRSRFDQISNFAGVERFLDTPLKRYSYGMRLRLAFAVAAHLETEIVAVDEVLAAGDAEFQRKCLGKMSDFGNTGRTTVFVSHDLGAVTRLCPRTVWLDGGKIVQDGPSARVVDAYLQSGAASPVASFPIDLAAPVQLTAVAVTDADGRVIESPRRDQEFSIRFRLRVSERIPGLDFSLTLVNQRGVQVLVDNWSDNRTSTNEMDRPGDYEAIARIPCILSTGQYTVTFWIGTAHEDLFQREVLGFRLGPRPGESSEELERPRAAAPYIAWAVRQIELSPATDSQAKRTKASPQADG